jgi:hypothetical protein
MQAKVAKIGSNQSGASEPIDVVEGTMKRESVSQVALENGFSF